MERERGREGARGVGFSVAPQVHGAPPLLFHNSGRKAPGFLLFNICSGRPISQWRKAHPFLLQRREAPPFSLHHSVTRSAPFVFHHSDEGLISLSYSLTHDLIWAFLNRNMSGGTLWAFFVFAADKRTYA